MKKKNIKNNKIIYITIISLGCILIIVGLIYFGINKPVENKVKKTKKEEEKYENIIADEYMPYYDYVVQNAYYFDNTFFNEYPINDVDKLSPRDKTYILLNIVGSDENNLTTVQQLLEAMPNHFTSFDLYLGDIKDSDGEVLYKFENNTYTYITSESPEYYMYTKELYNEITPTSWVAKKKMYFLKAYANNGKLIIDVYKSPKSKKKIYSYTSPSSMSLVGLSDEEFDKVKDKLDTITYQYIRSGENYILKSITTDK